jgi:hypothetical protein
VALLAAAAERGMQRGIDWFVIFEFASPLFGSYVVKGQEEQPAAGENWPHLVHSPLYRSVHSPLYRSVLSPLHTCAAARPCTGEQA